MTVMLLMVMLFTGNVAFATDYIKEVMVIGHDDEDQFNALQASLVQQGWIAINKDLNAGCGSSSDYIHLLYKKESTANNFNWDYITDFFISNTYESSKTYGDRTYYPVPCQGSDDFVNGHGDLNNNAGGKYIYLYYTRDNFSNRRVVNGISFNDTQSGAVPLEGSGDGYDLNKGVNGSDYIYMHLTTGTATLTLHGKGTANDPYIISNNNDWNHFTLMIQDAQGSNKCYQLSSNFGNVTTMAGTSSLPFGGTFDGNGHLIEVQIGSSESYTAPFHYINGATIKNLTVQGTVTSSAYCASGLAGLCNGTNTINNCTVFTNVNATGYGGGVVGNGGTSTLNLLNSNYAGTISGFTDYAGGLLGWCANMTLNMNNCYCNGSFEPSGNGKYHPIACKNGGSTVTVTAQSIFYPSYIIPTAAAPYIIPGAEGMPILDGSGITEYPYLISTSNDWQTFTIMIQDNQLYNKCYKLLNNINVSTMAGTSAQPFGGTFDGDGNTITVNISSSEAGSAPFHYINGATIKDLTVNGSVSSSARHASGLVGSCGGSNTITGCVVNANVNGAEYVGGMVGHGGTSTLNIIDSYYTGIISGFNHYAGGLLGWCDNMTLNLNNCLFKGSFSPASGGLYHPIACKNSVKTVQVSANDIYYLLDFAPTVTSDNVIQGAEGVAVSPTLIEGSWDLPVTAADGLTYYLYFSGKRLPYSYGFENNNLAAEGWTKTSKVSNIRKFYAHSGSYSFDMDDPNDEYLISPEFDGSAAMTVSFYAKSYFSSARASFQIGYSPTEELNDFIWGNTITTSTTYTLYEFYVPKGTKYIAVKKRKKVNIDEGLFLDDISITACYEPTPVNLAASNITDHSATVSWEAPETDLTITGYAYQYKKSSDANWSAEVTVGGNTTSVTLNNLTCLTTYQFHVKALYGNEESLYTDFISFYMNLASLPYEYGFENGMNGWTKCVDWPYTGIMEEARHYGNYGYCLNNHNDEEVIQYLLSPQFTGEAGITLSFYHLAYYWDADGSFFVGYSLGGSNPEQDFTWVSEIDFDDCYQIWCRYEHNFPTGTKYIAIKFVSANTLYRRYVYLDDFAFEEYSTYAKPTNLATSSLTHNSATLTWTKPNNSVTGYKYQYKKQTDANWSNEISINNGSATSVTINNLTANSNYDFRVKALYGGNNASSYVLTTFMTEGNPETPPCYQGFENGMGGWRTVNADRFSRILEEYPHGGLRSFEFYPIDEGEICLISPLLESNSDMLFSFYYINRSDETYSYTAGFQVGYSTTTKDPSAFTWSNMIVSSHEYRRYPAIVPEGTKYVAIKWVGGHIMYVDDISIEPVVSLNVTGYGTIATNGNWIFIASPVVGNLGPESVGNLKPDNESEFDLYRFNQSAAAEWENYKAHTGGFVLENGKGYLYANTNNTTLVFAGAMNNDASKTVNLVYNNNSPHADTRGWNLVGNPFPVTAYSNMSYYKMNAVGTDIEAVTSTSTGIPKCRGVLVRATGPNQTVTFTREGSKSDDKPESLGSLELTLTKGGTRGEDFHDKAIVSFDEGTQLEKFIFNEEHAKLYIPQGNEDYAIAFSNRQGEVPVHFKTKEVGTYTITVVETFPETSPETHGRASLQGVHLIDLLANVDIDLGVENSYTFIGKPSDRRARFKIVFKNVENEGNDIFAYQNGDDIIVSGDGELQIFDVMGRMVMNQHINGVETINKPSQSGIYILRLNGKSQKIVIK